ncbi:fasciclin domain-containing protein [Mucilaginibacter gynuensis]
MKKQNLNTLICLLLAMLAFGCQKQGYIPDPVGEKIPYADTVRPTLKEELAQSAATIFYAAWQRSHMDSILKAQTIGKTNFTLLVPANAAMETAGYNLQTIQSMEPKMLDSLLLYHTLRNNVTPQDITGKADNFIAPTLLIHPQFILSSLRNSIPYNYRQQLQVKDGKMYVNGKVGGTGKYQPAANGGMWFIDKVIPRPAKSLLQLVEEDGRFNLLLQIMRYTDEQWNKIVTDANGYSNKPAFSLRFAWQVMPVNTEPIKIVQTTLFLPTDDAFKAAGFNTLQDLVDFNKRRGLPYWGLNEFGSGDVIGNFATDTLLNYHMNWGKTFNIPKEYNASRVAQNAPIIFSNVMTNAVLSNYLITGGVKYGTNEDPEDPEYYMPFDFAKDASGIKVKVKRAEFTPARVIDADIPAINGSLNAVDHLLIPKGFKIN